MSENKNLSNEIAVIEIEELEEKAAPSVYWDTN